MDELQATNKKVTLEILQKRVVTVGLIGMGGWAFFFVAGFFGAAAWFTIKGAAEFIQYIQPIAMPFLVICTIMMVASAFVGIILHFKLKKLNKSKS